jgi:hypothetical protein
MPPRRSRSKTSDTAAPADSAAEEAAGSEAKAAAPAKPAAKKPAAKKPAAKKPAAKKPAAKKPAAKPAAPTKVAIPAAAIGKPQSHSSSLGPYGDDGNILYRIFDSSGDFANAVGSNKIADDDTTTLPDGGMCAFAIEDASGNRMGTMVSFQRQSGGTRHFDFDPGYNYWRFDRNAWGEKFILRPLSGTVGLAFVDPHKWEITGAYPFNGGENQSLPASVGRGRVWRVSKVAGRKTTAQDLYMWRVSGGPIKLQRWYGRPSSIKQAAWLALAAGEKLQFDAVAAPAKTDGAADFQTLILPEAP